MEPKDRESQEQSPAGQGGRGVWPATLGPWLGLGNGQPQASATDRPRGTPFQEAIQSALG